MNRDNPHIVHYIKFDVLLYSCVRKDQVEAFEHDLEQYIRSYFPDVDYHDAIIVEMAEHTGTLAACSDCGLLEEI